MKERMIQLRGQEGQRREIVRSIADSREHLVDWLESRGPDFAQLREKARSSSVSVGVGLLDDKLYENLTVMENLNLFARLSDVCPSSADAVSEMFGMAKYREDLFGKLSENLRHRLQLAVSMLPSPEIVIWEEPDFGDSEFVNRLFDWLEENEIHLIFSAEESLDGAACRVVDIEGEN